MRRSKKVYENYVCPKCFHKVNKCTCKLYPPYWLIMVDEKIQGHIRILNEKGYSTRVCCEGHKCGEEIYIGFNDFADELCFRPLPDGFENDKCEYIRCKIPRDCEDIEKFKDEHLAAFMEWIQRLPNRS